jgi:hypothetical protein
LPKIGENSGFEQKEIGFLRIYGGIAALYIKK